MAETDRIRAPPVVPTPTPSVMELSSPILYSMVAPTPINTNVVPHSLLPFESFLKTHSLPTIVEIQAVDGTILGAQFATTVIPPDENIGMMNIEPVELITHNFSSSNINTSTCFSI